MGRLLISVCKQTISSFRIKKKDRLSSVYIQLGAQKAERYMFSRFWFLELNNSDYIIPWINYVCSFLSYFVSHIFYISSSIISSRKVLHSFHLFEVGVVLNIKRRRPTWQILSKALQISKTTARASQLLWSASKTILIMAVSTFAVE